MGSGFKTFTAGAVLTASDVNNYLMEQGVMYFASTTARDAAITAPERGMTCYVGSNDVNEGFYTYNGTSWRRQAWNEPWGYIGSATITSTQTTTSTTPVDVTGLSVTFTAVANRRYKVSLCGGAYSSVTSDWPLLFIRDGAGTTLQQISVNSPSTTIPATSSTFVITTPSAGSTTYKASFDRNTGTGTVTYYASSIVPSILLVEDIGPSGAPA